MLACPRAGQRWIKSKGATRKKKGRKEKFAAYQKFASLLERKKKRSEKDEDQISVYVKPGEGICFNTYERSFGGGRIK